MQKQQKGSSKVAISAAVVKDQDVENKKPKYDFVIGKYLQINV